ncbi:MAG: MFS transporter [Proteobacteria bacterium]|nr:MFS transporter [Pseudomonadota bacterium]
MKLLDTLDKGLLPILFTVLLLAFGMSFVAPLIPLIIRDTGASASTIGQIASVYFLSFTLFTPLMGKFVDKAGSKKIIVTGLFIFTVSILLMIFAATPWHFYLIRIFQGIGIACLFAPTESAINVLSSPERRSSNMGLYGVVFAVGFAVGPGIGTYLYAYHQAVPFVFGAAFSMVGLFVMLTCYEDVPIALKTVDIRLHEFLKILRIPLLAGLCYAVVEASIGSFLSLYLDQLGFKGGSLGLAFTFFAIGGIVSPFPAGKAADRFGKIPSLYVLGIILTITTFLFTITANYFFIVFLCFAVGFVAGGLYPIALALIGDLIPPQQMGTANSTFSFLYGVGSIVGPVCTGWVVRLCGMQYLFYPMAVASFVFAVAALIDNRVNKRY